MKALVRITAALAAAFCIVAPVQAKTDSSHKPAHHGLSGLFHHSKKMHGASSGTTPSKPLFAGSIIGNKNTHVYHMKGDPGALPETQNRVYFRTEAQAIAAGYRRAGNTSGHHKGSAHKSHHSK